MFGRLAAVRIKAAEDAYERGRLDEAFEIASVEDLAGNRRVRSLLERLGGLLLERGQDHLLGKRFAEALADFNRAARCGGQADEVAEWRQRAMAAMADDQQAEHERQAALAAARQRLTAGSLAGAADALARVPADDSVRAAVSAEIARQTRRAEETLSAAKAALKKDHLAEAVERFRVARGLHTKSDGISEMETRIVESAVKQAKDEFKNGQVLRAEQALALLEDVGVGRPERTEMTEALRLARRAAKALNEDRYARAGILLGRLSQVGPKAAWISEVRKHLGVLEEHRRALLEGPLGLISGRDVPSAVGVSATGAPGPESRLVTSRFCRRGVASARGGSPHADETLPAGAHGIAHPADPAGDAAAPRPRPGALGASGVPPQARLPRRLLLRIDGVGSFLLLRGDRISIGRSGPESTASLPLISDLAERQAEIIRAGEDYFVVAQSGVELAGRHVDHALLQDGDKLRLGKRVRLRFSRPSLKSTSAALDLGDGVRTATDCRRVILWGGPLIMGNTRECHIRLGPDLGGAILMERGGQLLLKPTGPGGRAVPLVLGEQADLGGLRLGVQTWSDGTGVGKVIG